MSNTFIDSIVSSDEQLVRREFERLLEVPVELEPMGGVFEFTIRPLPGWAIRSFEATTRGAVRSSSGILESSYLVLVGRGGSAIQQVIGDDLVTATRNMAAVASPGDGVRGKTQAMASATVLRIPATLVVSELEDLAQVHSGRPPWLPRTLALDAGPGTLFGSALEQLARPPPAGDPERYGRWLERSLVQALLMPHLARLPEEKDRSHAARGLARAEGYIALHLGDPLTLGDLAVVAGISARALHLAFRTKHDLSPLGFVRKLRLDRARDELLRASGSVTEVAGACGFTHLGRFAEAYRRRFGETPSNTLRRHRASSAEVQ